MFLKVWSVDENILLCLIDVHVQSLIHVRLFTPWTPGIVARHAPLWLGFLVKNTEMGCRFLLQWTIVCQNSSLRLSTMRNTGLWPVLGSESQQMAVQSNHPLQQKNSKEKIKFTPALCPDFIFRPGSGKQSTFNPLCDGPETRAWGDLIHEYHEYQHRLKGHAYFSLVH